MVTFTTLRYGDVYLDEGWRLLSSFEANNGIILSGGTNAVVMTIVHRVYFNEKPLTSHPPDSGDKQTSGSKAD